MKNEFAKIRVKSSVVTQCSDLATLQSSLGHPFCASSGHAAGQEGGGGSQSPRQQTLKEHISPHEPRQFRLVRLDRLSPSRVSASCL